MEKSTNTLDSILLETGPDRIDGYLTENRAELVDGERPFYGYMKECIRQKGLQQQEVFVRADISDSYGYKLISGEKHTNRRDVVLRLCIGAKLTLEETQRALKIYGMSPLYSRFRRDAVIMVALNSGATEISEVNALLSENGMPILKGTEE